MILRLLLLQPLVPTATAITVALTLLLLLLWLLSHGTVPAVMLLHPLAAFSLLLPFSRHATHVHVLLRIT